MLERFRELMVRQLESSAAEQLAARISTRKLEASNERLIEKIRGICTNTDAADRGSVS